MTTRSRAPAAVGALTIALTALLCLGAAGPARAATWSTTSLPWLLYPNEKAAGPLPLTIPIPAAAWKYAARTQMVDLFARDQPVILHVIMQVEAGVVGVALSNSNGSTLLSKEDALKPTGGDADIYFRLRPGGPAGFILLRNYGAEGLAGSAIVKRVEFIREADLTNDELADIAKQGLH